MPPLIVADLGQLDGDVWLIGGPVSNVDATRTFADLIPADAPVVCTGDTVAYCAAASGTVELIREKGWSVIAGNVEKQLAEGLDDCGCGFGDGSACDLLSRGWYAHVASEIGPEDRAWMASLPDIAIFENRGRRYGVIHGGVTAINRFLWPTSDEAAFLEEIDAFRAMAGPVDSIIAGHSGLPFIREIAGTPWINAGSIGMPANDGSPETHYAVLSEDGPEILRMTYPIDRAYKRMRLAGLTQGYDRCLLTGEWPSEDVLPPELRRFSVP